MVTKGFEEIYITVHRCHAHGVKEPETPVTSKLMGRAVEEMRADRLAMEFNSQARLSAPRRPALFLEFRVRPRRPLLGRGQTVHGPGTQPPFPHLHRLPHRRTAQHLLVPAAGSSLLHGANPGGAGRAIPRLERERRIRALTAAKVLIRPCERRRRRC